MELLEVIKAIFQYGGTLIMAALFVWVFIQDKTKNNKMLEDNTQMLKVLTESNNNIAKSLDIIASDLKSFVTIAFTFTIIALVLIVAIKGNWDIFQIVFTLFSNIATAVFTYFFTRKTNVEKNTENETTNDINQD